MTDCSMVTGNVTELLTDDLVSEIGAQVDEYQSAALNYHEGELGVKAREDWRYYYGELPKPVCNGSSSWVDRSCHEAVNGTLQELMNVFTSGEDAVRFEPLHRGDGQMAIASTHLVNKALLRDNDGYQVLHDVFKESCVVRNSYIKYYWKEEKNTEVLEFQEMTQVELDTFLSQFDKEIIELVVEEDEETTLVSGTLTYVVDKEYVAVEFAPFEQILVESTATSLKEANYVAQRVRKTKAELRDMGFNDEIVDELQATSGDMDAGIIANERIDNISPVNVSDVVMTGDQQSDKVWLYENYLKTSLLSGNLELLQIFSCNGQILEINRVNQIPFVGIVPMPIPGFVFGESIVDLVKDIQSLNTALVRGMIDNIMNANFRRYMAVKGAYDRRSLLDNRPGGVIEVQSQNAVTPMQHHQLPQGVTQLLEYVEQKKEQRTGVTRLGQGLNADVFKNDNATATVGMMLSAAQNRMRMVCRNIAQGGMQELMLGIYRLIRENAKDPIELETAQGVITVEPSQLPHRDRMLVSVAVGPNERKERAQALAQMYQMTKGSPTASVFMQPQNEFYMIEEMYKSLGIFDTENYLTPPDQLPPPKPNPAQEIEVQALAENVKLVQAQTQKIINDMQLESGKFEFEQSKTADSFMMDKEKSLSDQDEQADKMTVEERKLQLEERKVLIEEAKLELERQRMLIEAQLEATQGRPVSVKTGSSS